MPIANNANSKYRKEVFDAVCRKGKKCGEVCIPKKSKCRDGQQKLSQPNSLQMSDLGKSALITGGILGGGIAIAGAGTLGAIAFSQQVKEDYVKGFTESGKIAEEESKKIQAPKLPANTKTAVFTVGGFGTKDAFSESLVLEENVKSLGIKNLYTEPIEYSDFNVANNPKKDGALKAAAEALQKFIETTVMKKHNPVARRLAAKVLAYQKANPNVDFQLIGHSGGGLTIQETNEILHTLGVKVRATAIGSPDFGIIPGNGDIVTAASDKDYIVNGTRGKAVNRKSFNNVEEHGQNAYFKDPDFRKFVRDRLVRSDRVDSVYSQSRTDAIKKAVCKVGKPCNDVCIPKKSVCRESGQSGSQSLKSPFLASSGIIKAGMAIGATTLGIPLATYAVQKARFQNGFAKSAELAKKQSEDYPVPDKLEAGYRSIADQVGSDGAEVKSRYTKNKVDQITFFTGGVGGIKGLEADYMGQQLGKMLPDHHVVGIESPEQEIVPEKGEKVFHPRFLQKAARTLLKDNLTKGRSEVAVRIAARAYAYHQKFPDKPINLVGQSGGGMPTREAYEILDKMGVKDVRVVTTGSPYFGLTRPNGLSLIDPDVDPVEKIYGITMPNKTKVKANGHSLYYSDVHYKITNNGQWTGEKDNNAWDAAQINKSTQDTLVKYFDRTKKDSISDSYTEGKDLILKKSLSGVGRLDATNSSKDLLKKQFSVLLSRAANKQIGQIINIKSSPSGEITGLFTLENKPFRFTFKDGNLSYQSTVKRSDSIYIYYDAAPKKGLLKGKRKRCKVGISCGSTCIEKDNVCKLKTSELAKPSEIMQLNQAIARFKLEENTQQINPEPKKEEDYIINPETGSNYTIRELRKVAASKGVVGYGSMPIDEMRAAIKLADRNPESAQRIVAGVARKRSLGTRAIAVSGLSGRNKSEREAKRRLKDVVATNKRLEALIKFTGSAPIAWTAGAVGAFLLGTTIRTYEQTKEKYREGFDESAKLAEERAVKLKLVHVLQDNITFAVGSGKGHGAEEIKKLLQREEPDNDGDYWLTQNNYVIPFNLQETGIDKESNETGSGDEILNGMRNYLQTFRRGKNQDAIDLAAHLYAYGIQRKASNPSELKNKYKKINVVAHGMAGQTTKEALELLSRMDIKGSPTGKEVLRQVNVVNLGTPHFGFAENQSRRHRTIISAQDPVSNIPNIGSGARQQWISSVKGHSVKDYLEDNRVRDAIRESFGYYEGSLEELGRREKKRIAFNAKRKAAVPPKESAPTPTPIPKEETPKPSTKKAPSSRTASKTSSPPSPDSQSESKEPEMEIPPNANILPPPKPPKNPPKTTRKPPTRKPKAPKNTTKTPPKKPSTQKPKTPKNPSKPRTTKTKPPDKEPPTTEKTDAYEIQRESTLIEIFGNQKSDVKLDFLNQCSRGNKRCGDICLPPEKKCRLNYSSNPKEYNKQRLLAKLGRGAVTGSLGGLGQDLERAYLRTKDLVDGIKNRNKPLTKKEKLKKAVTSEAKLLGVQLGLGTISKKLKEADKALIDLAEEKDIVSNQLKEKFGSESEKIRNFVESRMKK